MLIEAGIGYPGRLVEAIGHPVTWIGAMIGWFEPNFNREAASDRGRRTAGLVLVIALILVAGSVGFGIERGLLLVPYGRVAIAILASTLIAQRSLHAHVANVAQALKRDGLDAARRAVSHIVGRDTDVLDEAGVARAAIESLAENFSDGVVAPVFWLSVGGLGAGGAYKAINTADSMVGHRTSRYRAFGFAVARLDDLINLPASRLAALLLILAAATSQNASARAAWRAVRCDANRHRSPNAGYPEAAMAGALGLALAGPRIYDGVLVSDALMGDGRRAAGAEDIRAALSLYRRADLLLMLLLGIFAGIIALG